MYHAILIPLKVVHSNLIFDIQKPTGTTRPPPGHGSTGSAPGNQPNNRGPGQRRTQETPLPVRGAGTG